MIDLQDKEQRGKLLDAVQKSRDDLIPFRRTRKELLRDYVGSWWNGRGARYKTLVNLMNQTAKIYTVALAANNPKVLVSTHSPANWAFAKRFEANLNKLISDMNLARTFRAIVMDAFFSLGCAVVSMRDTDTRFHGLLESEEDVWFDPGEPWISRVSFDNQILDMTATDRSKMRFCGHRYRADLKKVKEEPGYDKDVVAKLTATKRNSEDGEGEANDLTGEADDDTLKDMVWLMDLWIPENGTVATFACDLGKDHLPPLIEREWTGNQDGPYKFLSLGLVPDSVMPSSPASNLKGLHDLQNRLHRKMERQADREKTVNVYSPDAEDDAKEHKKAKDGDWVRSKNPRDITQVKFGGVDAATQAFSMVIQDEYNRFAGNPSARAGLGAQAPTASQEAMIQEKISEQDAAMSEAVLQFATECCTDLGWLMWHDETLEIQSSMQIEGTDLSVDSSWPLRDEWGDRVLDGTFEDLDLTVEACSMPYKSPEQKVQEILGTLSELAPYWPLFQASGATIDVRALLQIVAELRSRPELTQIITFASPDDLAAATHGATQSPITRRETVRRNIPTGGTEQSRGAILAQALSNGQANQSQMGSLTRAPA